MSENSYFYSLLFNSAWGYFKRQLLTQKEYELTTEFAVSSEELTNHKVNLTEHLLRRMYDFCRRKNICLIILDIPRTSGTGFRSSVPENMRQFMTENSDIFVDSEQVLCDYNDMAEIHVPHGDRHISEFTHIVLGVKVAKEILARSERL